MINGNYINFAICEYYNDEVFTQLSKCLFTSFCSFEVSQLRQYEKICKQVYQLITHFFNNHLDLLFMKFELPLIEQVLRILQEGLSDPVFDVQTDAVNAVNTFNEYFFNKLKASQTAKKQA
jgi:hypothetical protein